MAMNKKKAGGGVAAALAAVLVAYGAFMEADHPGVTPINPVNPPAVTQKDLVQGDGLLIIGGDRSKILTNKPDSTWSLALVEELIEQLGDYEMEVLRVAPERWGYMDTIKAYREAVIVWRDALEEEEQKQERGP